MSYKYVTCELGALQFWYHSQVVIFLVLDGLWSMRSRVRRVRRLVIEVIVVMEYHC